MFWTDWGQPAKIERSGMDGSQRVTIVSSELQLPNGIAIDNVTERYNDYQFSFKLLISRFQPRSGGVGQKMNLGLLENF